SAPMTKLLGSTALAPGALVAAAAGEGFFSAGAASRALIPKTHSKDSRIATRQRVMALLYSRSARSYYRSFGWERGENPPRSPLICVTRRRIEAAAMSYFLAKTDPETYSIEKLEKERKTVWDGVRNPQALRAIREMRPGDRVFVYHSQGEVAIVGLAKLVSEPRPDPKDPKLTGVDVEYVGRVDPPVTLREIKESKLFDDWSLVRQSRLSTMAAPQEFVEWVRKKHPKAKI